MRAWQWLWRGDALRAARAKRAEELALWLPRTRAQIAAEVAERVLDPSSPWLSGDASHLAAGLFAESIGWSLRVTAELDPGATPAPAALQPTGSELATLLSSQREVLLQAARDAEVVDRVVRQILERDFERATSTHAEVASTARELGLVAARLLARLEAREPSAPTLVFQRTFRMLGAGIALVGLFWAGSFVLDFWETKANLALGKPWTTSSTYEFVCQSPHHECGQLKGYFFHTKDDDSPWFEVDLKKPETFSKVRVINRRECCGERALPLVVEVSQDHHSWREVSRRVDGFQDWTARFAPVSARWVRVRTARRSMLHLNDVRVLR